MNQNAKRLFHLLGGLISLVLIAYLCSRFFELRAAVANQLKDGFPLSTLAMASGFCLLAYFPISLGWAFLATPKRPLRTLPVSIEIVLLSQAARYLPGNVGHLIGRVLLTRRYLGVSAKLGSALMTIELLLSLASAVLLSASAIPQLAPLAPTWLADILRQPATLPISIVVAFAGAVIVGFIGKRWLQLSLPPLKILLRATLCYASALVVGGISLWLLLGAEHAPKVGLSLALLAYTTSWLAGFVTPGAPSGLGVREFILVRLLAPAIGEPQALLAAALLRLCSVSADVVAFGIGLILTRFAARPVAADETAPT